MAFFDNDDLDGACFIAGELGEVEELQIARTIWFDKTSPSANQPEEKVSFSGEQAALFFNWNFYGAHDADKNLNDLECAVIAFLRLLAARSGLVSPKFRVTDHNVTYNEAIEVDLAHTQSAFLTANAMDPKADPKDLHPKAVAVLKGPIKKDLRVNFSNIVCCVAYMFRVRGHHYLDDMDNSYTKLWKKCLKGTDFPHIKWNLIAHNALHAIMPDVLDHYWIRMAQASNIAGALSKRLDSAPAGVAGVRALNAGMQDLAATVPGFKVVNEKLYDEMERLVDRLKAERWAGSINRRFYAAGDLGFMEAQFAGIASTIVSALDQFAPTSPLRNSLALKRMAGAAPISGGFTARLIAAAANDPSNAAALVKPKA